jgi:probable phosphoglycerate mutase
MKSGSLYNEPERPADCVTAYTDGGARGNPGPSGYGVFIADADGRKLAELSQYLGHQTNNYAEYSGLLAALEWAVGNGHRAMQVVSDSELMVKQIKGIYKVSNLQLQELHAKAKRLIAQLEWFNIQHVLRGKNKDADRLANEAMDKGSGRPKPQTEAPAPAISGVLHGVVKRGKIELTDGELPEGTKVLIRKA